MAKHERHHEQNTSENTQAPASTNVGSVGVPDQPPASEGGASGVTDERHKLVLLDENYGEKNGTRVKRVDFIRDAYCNKRWSRGAIAKEINRLNKKEDPNAKDVKYQIVFAATKELVGGPVKSEAPASAPEGASAE